jgi:predicted small integral membrane protein
LVRAGDGLLSCLLLTDQGGGTVPIRYLKIVLVVFVGLTGLLFVAGNIANWDAGLELVGYVVSMEGHEIYSSHIFPPVTNPALITLAFLLILTGESLVGALSLKGAWDLWSARTGSADDFNAAKTYAVLGTGMAVVVWFGGFIVIGGVLFQMWQTEIGHGSFADAFILAAAGGLVLLFVNSPEA